MEFNENEDFYCTLDARIPHAWSQRAEHRMQDFELRLAAVEKHLTERLEWRSAR